MNPIVMKARRLAAAITGKPMPTKVEVAAAERGHIFRSCTSKVKFENYDEADKARGQTPYFCLHCGFWHRTTIRRWQ